MLIGTALWLVHSGVYLYSYSSCGFKFPGNESPDCFFFRNCVLTAIAFEKPNQLFQFLWIAECRSQFNYVYIWTFPLHSQSQLSNFSKARSDLWWGLISGSCWVSAECGWVSLMWFSKSSLLRKSSLHMGQHIGILKRLTSSYNFI